MASPEAATNQGGTKTLTGVLQEILRVIVTTPRVQTVWLGKKVKREVNETENKKKNRKRKIKRKYEKKNQKMKRKSKRTKKKNTGKEAQQTKERSYTKQENLHNRTSNGEFIPLCSSSVDLIPYPHTAPPFPVLRCTRELSPERSYVRPAYCFRSIYGFSDVRGSLPFVCADRLHSTLTSLCALSALLFSSPLPYLSKHQYVLPLMAPNVPPYPANNTNNDTNANQPHVPLHQPRHQIKITNKHLGHIAWKC